MIIQDKKGKYGICFINGNYHTKETMLADEIRIKSSEIFREAYQMSIGELANLYRDKELDIHPEFQRMYRWNDDQKSRLIESIMLNIPIPQIFVSQSDTGVWDVIDGLQRLSTIFQFMGILEDDKGEKIPALKLRKTNNLPSFEDMMWDNTEDSTHSFSREQQIDFKRARIDVVILKKSSDPKAKYELFQRLNTGGTHLSPQEVRNCLIIMSNSSFYKFIQSLDEVDDFQECVPITDRKTDEQYRLELISRLLVANSIDWDSVDDNGDISDLLDRGILECCNFEDYPYEEIRKDFLAAFRLLRETLGEDSFRRYVFEEKRFKGAFTVAAYDTISYGVFKNIRNITSMKNPQKYVENKIKEIYRQEEYINQATHGVRATTRYKKLSQWGVQYFNAKN